MLQIKNLQKNFNGKKAVNNISLDIQKGEIVSLIGPNGSGKTTIMKTICGLLRADSGSVSVGGSDVSSEAEKTKSLIGYIPDDPSVWPFMTGEEFIFFSQALYEIPVSERRDKLPELLAKFSLSGIEKEYFEDYSRGNKQKFSILAALSHKPSLLLIDEPIVGLDPVSALRAKKEFVFFKESGGSILLATHTLPVAEEISDRIAVLDKGNLLALDTFSNLQKKAGLPESASLEEVYQKIVK